MDSLGSFPGNAQEKGQNIANIRADIERSARSREETGISCSGNKRKAERPTTLSHRNNSQGRRAISENYIVVKDLGSLSLRRDDVLSKKHKRKKTKKVLVNGSSHSDRGHGPRLPRRQELHQKIGHTRRTGEGGVGFQDGWGA